MVLNRGGNDGRDFTEESETAGRPGGCAPDAPNLWTESFVVHKGFRPAVTGARQGQKKKALLLKT